MDDSYNFDNLELFSVWNMLIPRLPTAIKELLGDRDKLAAISANYTSRQLPGIIGCSRATILRALKKHGLSKPNGLYKRSDKNILDNRLKNMPQQAIGYVDNRCWLSKQYIDDNRSALDIGRELGLSKTAVYRWIHKFGLKKNKQSCKRAAAAGYLLATGFAIDSPEASAKRMGGHRSYDVITAKGGVIRCHSKWEEQAALIMDSHPRVINFKKEPVPIPYEFAGQKMYWPDFMVECQTRTILLEIKADRLLSDSMVKAKLNAGKGFALINGYHWSVIGGINLFRADDLTELLNAS